MEYLRIVLLGCALLLCYRIGHRIGVLQTRELWRALVRKTAAKVPLPTTADEGQARKAVLLKGLLNTALTGQFGNN